MHYVYIDNCSRLLKNFRLRRASKRERGKNKKFGFTRVSPPANTWDTLEKRWDTFAPILAPALVNGLLFAAVGVAFKYCLRASFTAAVLTCKKQNGIIRLMNSSVRTSRAVLGLTNKPPETKFFCLVFAGFWETSAATVGLTSVESRRGDKAEEAEEEEE